jgi:uncharacterized cupin superfamily protein
VRRLPVLLTVVTVLVSMIAFGPGSAVVAQDATPAAEAVMLEPLVAVAVPAEDLPTGTDLGFEIWYATIDPGVEVTIPAEYFACCPGPEIEHVLAGELTFRVGGPLQVIRAGTAGTPGPVEEIPPDSEVVLRAGDTAAYAGERARVYANRGTEPVRLASGGLFERGATSGPPPGYLVTNYDPIDLESSLPAGPISFVLQRATLPPGAVLPGPPPGEFHVVTSGPAVAYLPKASDGSISNLVREPVVAYVLTLNPAQTSATPTP